jgi:hypothetical protein
MEQAHTNPLVAKFNELMNRREAWKWSRKHGELLMREILCALMDEERFSPARWLWNAAHPHIPLHCFFRTRGTPVLRFVEMKVQPQAVTSSSSTAAARPSPPVQRAVLTSSQPPQRTLLVERRHLI